MVSEKFAEAFDRFLETVNVEKMLSAKRLTDEQKTAVVITSFENWADGRWIPTFKQTTNLEDAATMLIDGRWLRGRQGRAIATMLQKQREEALEQAKAVAEKPQGRSVRQFSRNYANFNVWKEQTTTRTTAYQRRIMLYMQKHPDATLEQARGHR